MFTEPKLVCLTPCRNEAWVIDVMLTAASQWADHIIVGDQMSTDGTRDIVRRHPKAILADNLGQVYDEGERHRVVFEEARKIPGPKILLAIDADEVVSANWRTSPEWQRMKQLPPGTAIYAEWVNLRPDFDTGFLYGGPFIIGYVDDGKIEHSPGRFHVPRLLPTANAPRFQFKEIKLLHYQYADESRFRSKNRGYQVDEWCSNPTRPVRLFRRYNPMYTRDFQYADKLPRELIHGLDESGVPWRSIQYDSQYRWDANVIQAFLERGCSFFRRLDIWDPNWEILAQKWSINLHGKSLKDPRSFFDRAIHRFLRRSQANMAAWHTRILQNVLRPLGW